MLAEVNPSQLYMSLDAPDLETYLRICQPKSPELWNRINESLDIMKEKSSRTVIRTTLVKGENMFNPKGYADLIKKRLARFCRNKSLYASWFLTPPP